MSGGGVGVVDEVVDGLADAAGGVAIVGEAAQVLKAHPVQRAVAEHVVERGGELFVDNARELDGAQALTRRREELAAAGDVNGDEVPRGDADGAELDPRPQRQELRWSRYLS